MNQKEYIYISPVNLEYVYITHLKEPSWSKINHVLSIPMPTPIFLPANIVTTYTNINEFINDQQICLLIGNFDIDEFRLEFRPVVTYIYKNQLVFPNFILDST